MSIRKNLHLLLATSLLVTVASCGNDSNSSSRREKNAVCSEIDCLSSINWKIVLQGRAFPDKARVDINGTTILNECVSKQKYTIDRLSEPQHLYLDNFFVPKRGELQINVVDLGPDCSYESTFISNDKVDFEVSKSTGVSEILINL